MSVDRPSDEKDLAERVRSRAPGAAEEFLERFAKPVGDYLNSLCSTGLDKEKAKEIVNGLLARCCSGELLGAFRGEGSLEGWLKIIARNELKKHWEAEDRRPEKVSIQAREEAGLETTLAGTSETDCEEGVPEGVDYESFRDHLAEATAHAFRRLREEFPDRLAILRLATLHDVKQTHLAKAFGIHEAEISKKKTSGIEFLKSEIDTYLSSRFPRNRFTWGDLHEFARAFAELVHDEDLAD